MKKLLCLFLVLIAFLSGCTNAKPPLESKSSESSNSINNDSDNEQHSEALGTIGIGDINLLEDIRDILEGDEMADDEFYDFILAASPLVKISGRGIIKEDFVVLLNLFDSMTVPVLPDAKLTYISYSPDRFYGRFKLSYSTEEGESYRFTFFPFSDNFYFDNMITNYTNEEPALLYQKNEENIKVYENNVYSTPGACWFCLDISGKFYESSFSNSDLKAGIIDISMITAEDVYKDLTVGPLKNVPWIDRTSS